MNRRTFSSSLVGLAACLTAFFLVGSPARAADAPAKSTVSAKAEKPMAKKAMAKKSTVKSAHMTRAAHARHFSGEVVDLACYLGHGAHGAKHAGCARGCLSKGEPAGLLSHHHVYLLLGNPAHADAFASVRKLAAEHVTITGTSMWRHGMHAIVVDAVEHKVGTSKQAKAD